MNKKILWSCANKLKTFLCIKTEDDVQKSMEMFFFVFFINKGSRFQAKYVS